MMDVNQICVLALMFQRVNMLITHVLEGRLTYELSGFFFIYKYTTIDNPELVSAPGS